MTVTAYNDYGVNEDSIQRWRERTMMTAYADDCTMMIAAYNDDGSLI